MCVTFPYTISYDPTYMYATTSSRCSYMLTTHCACLAAIANFFVDMMAKNITDELSSAENYEKGNIFFQSLLWMDILRNLSIKNLFTLTQLGINDI